MLQAAEKFWFHIVISSCYVSWKLIQLHRFRESLGIQKILCFCLSSYTAPDQLKEPSIKLMNLHFSLSDVLLLLELRDDSSAAGADELTSFLLH